MNRLPLLLPAVVLCAACTESVDPLDLAGDPASVSAVSASVLQSSIGADVPVIVRASDAEGRPVPGVEVAFEPTAGTAVPAVDTTDSEGLARTTWTMPATAGSARLAAVADGLAPLVISAAVGPIPGDVVFRYLDAGGYHACGITTTEQLLCWGYGADGQLGIGSRDLKPFPTLIPGDNRYRRVTGGYYHSCGFTLASTVWCWGNSADGRLGDGSLATEITEPVRAITSVDTLILGGEIVVLPGPQLVAQGLQAGELHTCAIDLAQHAWCWGGNPEGGVGVGEFGPSNFRPLPVLVLTTELFKSVTVGGLHTCGITLAGGGRCWGYNIVGQLGNGGNSSSGEPVVVGGFSFRTDPLVIFRSPDPAFPLPPGPFMAAGYDHTCGITTGNQAVCWGLNQDGQLGDNSRQTRNTPDEVAGGHTFIAVTAGLRHTCALDNTGAAWCWGDNDFGQVGNGETRADVLAPAAVAGDIRFAYIKAGELFTCGVTSDGAAYCWGDNEYGQLGDGTTISSSVPVKVAFQP